MSQLITASVTHSHVACCLSYIAFSYLVFNGVLTRQYIHVFLLCGFWEVKKEVMFLLMVHVVAAGRNRPHEKWKVNKSDVLICTCYYLSRRQCHTVGLEWRQVVSFVNQSTHYNIRVLM